jgi:hypothetical protein
MLDSIDFFFKKNTKNSIKIFQKNTKNTYPASYFFKISKNTWKLLRIARPRLSSLARAGV